MPTWTLQGLPREKSTHAVTGPRQTSSSKSPGLRPCSQPKGQYRKTIANATCLRMVYVPTDMHRGLSMASMYPMQPSGRRKNTGVVTLSAVPGSSYPVNDTEYFKEASSSPTVNRLARFLCATVGVQIGDTLTFSQGCHLNELRVRVTRKIKQPGLQGTATAPISICPLQNIHAKSGRA